MRVGMHRHLAARRKSHLEDPDVVVLQCDPTSLWVDLGRVGYLLHIPPIGLQTNE